MNSEKILAFCPEEIYVLIRSIDVPLIDVLQVRTEGVRALYKGFVPIWSRMVSLAKCMLSILVYKFKWCAVSGGGWVWGGRGGGGGKGL